MAYTNADLRVLTHTARIVTAQAATSKHPRAKEYDAQLKDYRKRWKAFDATARSEMITAATEHIADLDAPRIAAAVAALEG